LLLHTGDGRALPVVRWAADLVIVSLVLCYSCSRMPDRPSPSRAGFDTVAARRQIFKGLEAEGELTVEHTTGTITIPLEVEVSGDLGLEIKGEISHFLLPFEGEFRLVSDEETTLLHTDNGAYDLAMEPGAQPAVRAFLLSMAGGGDWLLWWLEENHCDPAAKSVCYGLEIELEPDEILPSVREWGIKEAASAAAFTARVEAYEPGTLLPRAIKGRLYPQEITVYLKYTEIREAPGAGRIGDVH